MASGFSWNAQSDVSTLEDPYTSSELEEPRPSWAEEHLLRTSADVDRVLCQTDLAASVEEPFPPAADDQWPMNTITSALEEVRQQGISEENLRDLFKENGQDDSAPSVSSEEVIRRIELVMASVAHSVAKGEEPALVTQNRTSWSNISFDPNTGLVMTSNAALKTIRLNSNTSSQRFSLMMKTLAKIRQLILTSTYCTKRELYYQDVTLFPNQGVLDDIVDDISCMLSVPRWHLNILASSKGLVAGSLSFTSGTEFVDCSSTTTGVLIPNHVQGICNLKTRANFVLVVEKDASFQMLLDQNLQQAVGPHILITGKGFPDVNTRLFVRLLWEHFQLPTLCLVDADPHGIEIMTTYKYGSKAQSYEAKHLTLPSMRWLGILPSEIPRFASISTSLLKLSDRDMKKARELLTRPFIAAQPQWKSEIEHLLASRVKAEIQCLSQISFDFLSNVYIPNKIRNSSWL